MLVANCALMIVASLGEFDGLNKVLFDSSGDFGVE
jgi:hypothetical protein